MLFSNLAEILENEFTATAESLKLTETEYTFLRVICFLTPGKGLKAQMEQNSFCTRRGRLLEIKILILSKQLLEQAPSKLKKFSIIFDFDLYGTHYR